ncbi:hypothetical protein KVT40_003706 [Elsinoe batatas]|uniref:Uncharacterized protein n=1 Tax=Elsinoe batatas TaxID=2601811 RepID=A0A8K0L8U2_9PEZI|nr:hypothetical protein KVT40_003706 [Elsinoe batatas]
MGLFRRAGPYAPDTQLLGGTPSVLPDAPVSAALLALFLVAGVTNFAIFKWNKKNGHKFVINAALFGFGKIRIGTFSLRIAWACFPRSVNLGLVSTDFVYAGTIILFGINFIFAQRIIRAQHPTFGWAKGFKIVFALLFAVVILTLIAVIVAVLQSFFTLDPNIHRIDRSIQLCGSTCFAVMGFLPAPVVLLSTLIGLLPSIQRKRLTQPTDKFGEGRMRTKIWICIIAACILTLGAAFRAGTGWLPPTSVFLPGPPGPDGPILQEPPWYLSKACFYCFNFVTELFVVYMWLISRVDQSFFVPDKANGAYYPRPEPLQYDIDTGLSSVWSVNAFHNRAMRDDEGGEALHDFDPYDLKQKEPEQVTSSRNSMMTTHTDSTRRTRGSWQVEGPHQVLRFV